MTNFPADQLVHFTEPIDVDVLTMPTPVAVTGPLTAAELAAALPLAVTGPLTDAELAARLPFAVTGPLTDTELRASAVDVDGSAVTQPVSVDELPLPDGAADNATLSEVALTAILEREKIAGT